MLIVQIKNHPDYPSDRIVGMGVQQENGDWVVGDTRIPKHLFDARVFVSTDPVWHSGD